jgi:cell division protein FtsN
MAKSINKQRGGTLLGIIIGALLGLGAALAVAVYVTKVPIPFMNRAQPHSAENDAAEAKKNRDWDPNAPLAGKNPARPAPAPAGSAAAPGVDAGNTPILPPRSAATDNPPASGDPLGDLANARAKAKATAKPDAAVSASGVDPFSYFIQAGAFRTPEDAEQQRAKLSLLGFQSRVTEREQAGRTVYRVRLGPFDKKDEADKVKERLDGNSVDTALVRVQR